VALPSCGDEQAANMPSVLISGEIFFASSGVIIRLGTPRLFCRATDSVKTSTLVWSDSR